MVRARFEIEQPWFELDLRSYGAAAPPYVAGLTWRVHAELLPLRPLPLPPIKLLQLRAVATGGDPGELLQLAETLA